MASELNKWSLERSLAVGLLAVVFGLMILAVFLPAFNQWASLNDEKNQLALKLKQYEKILAGKQQVLKNIDALKNEIQGQNYFNRQSTEALASAEVQESIKKAIVDAGGQLSSTQALPVKTKDNFSLITVSVRMTGNAEVLRSVLYRLETSKPLIVVNQLDIRPMRGTRNPRTRQLDPTNEMNINFQAVSYMRKKPE